MSKVDRLRHIRIHRKGFHVRPTIIHRNGKVIHRKGFDVPPTTYEKVDLGKRGKGPKLIPINQPGALTKYGYATNKSARSRHRALARAVKRYGALSVFRMLNAQYVYRKRTQKSIGKIFKRDRDWIRKNHMR